MSLLSLEDLTHLLSCHCGAARRGDGSILALGNPQTVSLLSLAYLVRTNLPHKIELSFDSGAEVVGVVAEVVDYTSTLESLGEGPKETINSNLKKYLHDHVKMSPKSPAVAPPPVAPPQPTVPLPQKEPLAVKKLTPLRAPSAVFVPLEPRRTKRQLSLHLPSFPKRSRPRPPRLRSVVGRGVVIAIALYLGTLAFSSTIAFMSARHLAKQVMASETPTTSPLNKFTLTYLRANWVALTSIPVVAKQPSVAEVSLLLDAYSQSLSVFETATSLSATTSDLIHYVFGTGNADVAQSLSRSRLEVEELYQKLSLLDGSLPEEPPLILSEKYQGQYRDAKSKLKDLKHSVITSKALLASVPDIIGLGGRRKYGVLFQNNMELRATGGFIGSFSILSFENGKLYDMPIYDVYDADGQLKGHVEPPKPIKDILGEANWYLRDSNFDPDFPTSARRAEWFIKKSLNQDLDGTIAVNITSLTDLLKATGPLTVPDYNETITAENLYERSQFHAEVNFFPGSTQKKEFLSTVANTLFTRLPNIGEGEALKIIAALTQTVESKNTLISMLNPTTDHVFATLGWNGGVNDFPCPTTSICHKDYAMVVDANFGVNKANYYIERDIEEVITFDKDLLVNHTLRLRYRNASTSSAWPAGTYKNYQRLYLPQGTSIASIKLDDKVLEAKDYTLTAEHGKFVVAYLVQVPISSQVNVEVSYTTPQLPQESELLYTWYWQKQSGTSSSDNVSVYLNYPLYLRPAVISPQAELAPQQLKFNFQNDTDHRVTVKFTK